MFLEMLNNPSKVCSTFVVITSHWSNGPLRRKTQLRRPELLMLQWYVMLLAWDESRFVSIPEKLGDALMRIVDQLGQKVAQKTFWIWLQLSLPQKDWRHAWDLEMQLTWLDHLWLAASICPKIILLQLVFHLSFSSSSFSIFDRKINIWRK